MSVPRWRPDQREMLNAAIQRCQRCPAIPDFPCDPCVLKWKVRQAHQDIYNARSNLVEAQNRLTELERQLNLVRAAQGS